MLFRDKKKSCKNLAQSKNYLHLCVDKNLTMFRKPLHIETANWFSPIGDYTMRGAGYATE